MGRKSVTTDDNSNSEFTDNTGIRNTENTDTEYSGTIETDTGLYNEHSEGINSATTTTAATTTDQPKRGRGRPKGSGNASKEKTSFSVSEKVVKKRPAKSRSTDEEERKLYSPAEAKAAADILLTLTESLAVSSLGDKARFTLIERTLLEESIPKMLERMSAGTAEKTANFMYPAMLGFATVTYGVRMIRLSRDQNEAIPNSIPPSYEQFEQDKPDDKPKDNGSFNPGWLSGRDI